MKRYALILTCSLVLGTAEAAKVEETLAAVNGDPIYLTEYQNNLQNLLEDLKRNSATELTAVQQADIKQKVMEQMVDDLLLLQEAKKQEVKVFKKDIDSGVDEVKSRFKKDEAGRPTTTAQADEAFQEEIRKQKLTYADFEDRIRKQLMVIKLVDTLIKPKVTPPSEKQTQEFFEKIRVAVESKDKKVANATDKEEEEEIVKLSQLLRDRISERIRARHILVKVPAGAAMTEKSKALKQAKDIKKELDAGGDFSELAMKHSEDTASAKMGGDLGYFIRGWMVPAFEKSAFALPIGQVSEPVETEFGYHIIMVEEKRAATKLKYKDVQEDLAQYLAQRRFQQALRDFVSDLRKSATIKINKDVSQLPI